MNVPVVIAKLVSSIQSLAFNPEGFTEVAAALVGASFLALAVKSIVQALAEPVKKKYPDLDMWWLIYVTWVIGGALSFVAKINIFSPILPEMPAVLGLVLTAIVTGGGSSLIYDIFDKKVEVTELSAVISEKE